MADTYFEALSIEMELHWAKAGASWKASCGRNPLCGRLLQLALQREMFPTIHSLHVPQVPSVTTFYIINMEVAFLPFFRPESFPKQPFCFTFPAAWLDASTPYPKLHIPSPGAGVGSFLTAAPTVISSRPQDYFLEGTALHCFTKVQFRCTFPALDRCKAEARRSWIR